MLIRPTLFIVAALVSTAATAGSSSSWSDLSKPAKPSWTKPSDDKGEKGKSDWNDGPKLPDPSECLPLTDDKGTPGKPGSDLHDEGPKWDDSWSHHDGKDYEGGSHHWGDHFDHGPVCDVPEPSTYALALAGVGALLLRRKSR